MSLQQQNLVFLGLSIDIRFFTELSFLAVNRRTNNNNHNEFTWHIYSLKATISVIEISEMYNVLMTRQPSTKTHN